MAFRPSGLEHSVWTSYATACPYTIFMSIHLYAVFPSLAGVKLLPTRPTTHVRFPADLWIFISQLFFWTGSESNSGLYLAGTVDKAV
jgi:hypothetical protein